MTSGRCSSKWPFPGFKWPPCRESNGHLVQDLSHTGELRSERNPQNHHLPQKRCFFAEELIKLAEIARFFGSIPSSFLWLNSEIRHDAWNLKLVWISYHILSRKPFHRTQEHSLTQQPSQALKADFDAEALSLPGTDPAPINKWVDSKTQGLNLGQKRAKRSW